jgi:glycosyltransferase involved in cell wall biosynthesis
MRMSDGPLVSCIVPAFNAQEYIEETLASIHAQTYTSIEVVVVDDGSTDDTAGAVARFRPKVRYLYQENAGPAAARNRGIEETRGDMMAFLDADDVWHPEKLERQMARFEARPELDYCVTHVQNFWIPELQTEADQFKGHPRSNPVPGYSSATMLAKRSLFEAIGCFDTTLQHADAMAWFLRASEHGAIGELLPDTLVFRRLHDLNRSRVHGKRSGSEYLQLLKAKIDRQRALARKLASDLTGPADKRPPS